MVRRGATVLALLSLSVGIFLAVLSVNAGIHADDAALYKSFLMSDLPGKIQFFWNGIPGRNLQVIWQYGAYFAAVRTPGDFAAYHVMQSLFVGLNLWLLGMLMIRLRVRLGLAALVTLLYGLWPIYAEVYFWPNALVVHVFSATLILLLMHMLLWSWRRPDDWLPIVLVIVTFLLAAFSYDQNVTSGSALVAAWLLAGSVRARKADSWRRFRAKAAVVLLVLIGTVVLYGFILFEIRPGRSGFVVTSSPAPKLLEGLWSFATSLGLSEGVPRIVDGLGLQVAGGILRGLFLVAIVTLFVVALRRKVDPSTIQGRVRARYWLLLILVALGGAIAAYAPSWAWVVALRHNYYPVLFVCLAYGLAFEGFIEAVSVRFRKAVAAAVMTALAATCVFASVELLDEARAWNERADLRRDVYQRVADLVSTEPDGRVKCVKFVAVDIYDYAVPFYSESMFNALDIYARDPYNPTPCSGEWIPKENGCADGFFPRTDPSVTYIEFPYNADGSRNWRGATVAIRCI